MELKADAFFKNTPVDAYVSQFYSLASIEVGFDA